MERWQGKVAIVTGANSGIGASIALRLLELKVTVVAVDRAVDAIQQLQSSGKWRDTLHIRQVDLTKDEGVMDTFRWTEQSVGVVQILVNAAGVLGSTSLLDGTPAEWRSLLDVNVVALCLCTKEAVATMMKHSVKEGHIINMSSNFVNRVPMHAPFHFYTATKHAVKAITEGLRMELNNNESIRITSISPGLVQSSLYKPLGDEFEKFVYEKYPSIKPEDIAAAVEYILSTPPNVLVHDVCLKPKGSEN